MVLRDGHTVMLVDGHILHGWSCLCWWLMFVLMDGPVCVDGHVCVDGWSCLCQWLVMFVLVAGLVRGWSCLLMNGHVCVGCWSHTCIGGHMLLATTVKIRSNPPEVCLVLYGSLFTK